MPCFFFNDSTTPEIYTLSLHDALPISDLQHLPLPALERMEPFVLQLDQRSEEHTSELQSCEKLVCRLLLEKKNKYAAVRRRGRTILVSIANMCLRLDSTLFARQDFSR